MVTGRRSPGARSNCLLMVDTNQSFILPQGLAQVHMTRQRLHLASIDQDLHAGDGREIGREHRHDRVGGQQLVVRAARQALHEGAVEIDVGVVAARQEHAAHGHVLGHGPQQRRDRLGAELCFDERARLRHGCGAQRHVVRHAHQAHAVFRHEVEGGGDARADGRRRLGHACGRLGVGRGQRRAGGPAPRRGPLPDRAPRRRRLR